MVFSCSCRALKAFRASADVSECVPSIAVSNAHELETISCKHNVREQPKSIDQSFVLFRPPGKQAHGKQANIFLPRDCTTERALGPIISPHSAFCKDVTRLCAFAATTHKFFLETRVMCVSRHDHAWRTPSESGRDETTDKPAHLHRREREKTNIFVNRGFLDERALRSDISCLALKIR